MDAAKGPLTRTARLSEIRLENRDGKLLMLGRKKIPAELGEWAFVQLCGLLAAPDDYLRRMPPTLIAQCLNNGLSRIEEAEDHDAILVLCAADDDDDAWTVRSITKKQVEEEQ